MTVWRLLALTIVTFYFAAIFLFLYYQPSPFDATTLYAPSSTPCRCPEILTLAPVSARESTTESTTVETPATVAASPPPPRPPAHTLAVMVPFRDRWEELTEFVPHMHTFLNLQNVSHEIWVINQADKHRLGPLCMSTRLFIML